VQRKVAVIISSICRDNRKPSQVNTPVHRVSIQRAETKPIPAPVSVNEGTEASEAAPGCGVLLLEAVPFRRIALALKASKLFDPPSTAFTLKTMPAPQCDEGLVCLQYTQIGAVSLTVMLKSWGMRSPGVTGSNPESKPRLGVVSPRGRQGLANDDCVAV